MANMSTYDEAVHLDEETILKQAKIIEHLSTLKDEHHADDKEWFCKLIQNCHHRKESEEIDLGISFNTTMLDMITAKMMNIDPRLIIKADIIKTYIKDLWFKNELNINILEEHIINNPQYRSAIATILRPSDAQTQPNSDLAPQVTQHQTYIEQPVEHLAEIQYQQQLLQHSEINQTTEQITTTQVELIETPLQEIDMVEATTENNEEVADVTSHDIKEIPIYQIRNRTVQPDNPFYLVKDGDYKAGVLMANTPGENKEEQTNYLLHTLRLSKENKKLIGSEFTKGNYWFTFHFKHQLDMCNCVKRINEKIKGEFKILYLKGKPEEEDVKKSIPNEPGKRADQMPTKVIQKKPENKYAEKQKGKETIKKHTNALETSKDIRKDNRTTHNNPYKLVKNKTDTGIGMLVGTFPGNNRQDQLAILAEVFEISEDNDLINIEHRNGNSWFTGYFKKEEERTYCIRKMEEINKEIINLDASATSKTFKVHKLDTPRAKAQPGTNTMDQSSKIKKNQMHDPKDSRINKDQTTPSNHSEELKVQIFDIPIDFTTDRIKGAIRRYGLVSQIRTKIDKRKKLKSATVTFSELKIDLNKTWAIPMGENMARITPHQYWGETLRERNQYTARLYGINSSTSAIRVMSAAKHVNAKTVHVPLNSHTGKRRKFAIIGFETELDLASAINRHIYLFGNKTWWSTKDNSKTLEKNRTYYQKKKTDEESIADLTEEEEEWSSTEDDMLHYNTVKQEKARGKKEKKQDDMAQRSDSNYTNDNILQQLSQQLHLLNRRMERLEKGNNPKREIRSRPNFS